MNNQSPLFTAAQLETAEEVLGAIADEIERAPKPRWNDPLTRITHHYLHSVTLHLERVLRQRRRQIQHQNTAK